MALFVSIAFDKPNTAALRQATRPAHLEFLRRRSDVKLGGPFLSPSGEMIGSLLILEGEDEAAVRAVFEQEPYCRAGLFVEVQIRPWRCTVGTLA